MIELTKAFRRNDMLFSLTISIDQRYAGIHDEIEQKIVEAYLEMYIGKIAEGDEDSELELYNYIKRDLFTKLIDYKVVDDFMIAITKTVRMAVEKMDHKGFIYLFDFYL